MSDLISRNNLLEIVEQTKRCLKPLNSDYMQGYTEALAGVEKVIEMQPTVEAVTVVRLQEIADRLEEKSECLLESYEKDGDIMDLYLHIAFLNAITCIKKVEVCQ